MRPATDFDDIATMLGPKKPDSNVCWCLSYRIPGKLNQSLHRQERGAYVKELCDSGIPMGILVYDDADEVVGWAAVSPRRDTTFATNRKIPHVDDLDVWSVWCIRVRPGHRKQGIAHHLVDGAVQYARDNGAPALEAYPVDNDGAKVDLTMAYVGTRKMFEDGGFTYVTDTDSVLNRFPRVLMRHDLD